MMSWSINRIILVLIIINPPHRPLLPLNAASRTFLYPFKRFHPLPPAALSPRRRYSPCHGINTPQKGGPAIGYQATEQGGSDEGAKGTLCKAAEGASSKDKAKQLDH
jgi:hypothetical protein